MALMQFERFWVPRDGRARLDADGFLADPESPTRWLPTDARAWSHFEHVPCLVLLGEAGLGKSTALQAIEGTVRAAGGATLRVDLRDGDARDAAEEIRRRLTTGCGSRDEDPLHVYLDSLDEAAALDSRYSGHLGGQLRSLIGELGGDAATCLRLRVACRTADWSGRLETVLREVWGSDSVEVLELLPLRRKDVDEAVERRGGDPKAFGAELEATGATPFATTPITLKPLLDQFGGSQQLSRDPCALYRVMCLALAREWDDKRSARPATTDEARLAGARRIAAAAVLSGARAVGEGNGDYLQLGDVQRDHRDGAGSVAPPTFEALREALGTRLFRGSTRDGRWFAHESYAEYLCAAYLAERKLEQASLLSLLTGEVGSTERVLPHLTGVSGWLARHSRGWFDWVLEHEPESLLHAAVPLATDDQAICLTRRLLERARDERPVDTRRVRSFAVLRCPGLADELRPRIEGASEYRLHAQLAIEIGCLCAPDELSEAVAGVALDPGRPLDLRIEAASWLQHSPSEQVRGALRPLLDAPWTDTKADQLRERAFEALWHGLSPDDLFAAVGFAHMTQDERGFVHGVGGVSDTFLERTVAPALGERHAEAGLRWLSNLGADSDYSTAHRAFAAAVARVAAEYLTPAALADAYVSIDPHVSGCGALQLLTGAVRESAPDADARRGFVEAVVARWQDDPGMADRFRSWPLREAARVGDLAWALARAVEARDPSEKQFWAGLVCWPLGEASPDQADAVLRARDDDPELDRLLGPRSTDLSSEVAEWSLKQARRELAEQHAPERSAHLIAQVLASDGLAPAEAWTTVLGLCWGPGLRRDEGITGGLRALPLWGAVEPHLEQFLRAARAFLEAYDPKVAELLRDCREQRWWPDGWAALRLLFEERPEWISDEQWQRWAPAVWCRFGRDGSDEAARVRATALAAEAGRRAGAAVAEAMGAVARWPQEHALLAGLRLGDSAAFDSPEVREALAGIIADASVPVDSWEGALDAYFRLDPVSAASCALVEIESACTSGQELDLRALPAAWLLMRHAPKETAAKLWPQLGQPSSLLSTLVARADRAEGAWRALIAVSGVPDLARLVGWLLLDLIDDDSGWVPDDGPSRVYHWTVKHLQDLATGEAVEALQRLHAEFPGRGLQWTAHEATTRSLAERPRPTAEEALSICDRAGVVFVGTDAALADLVASSLQRWPNGAFVWGRKLLCGGHEPQDEEPVSDQLEDWLKRDLVERRRTTALASVTRETQAAKSPRRGRRDSTDLLVTLSRVGQEELRVVVEVKCPWHHCIRAGKQPIRTELVDRYLTREHPCGVFAVPRLLCDGWADSDQRKGKAARYSGKRLATLVGRLTDEAELLRREGWWVEVVVVDARVR